MEKETKKYALQIATASSMGIALVLTIFGSFYLGLFLDSKLGTKHFFAFSFFFLGIFVGLKNFYVLIKRTFSDEKKENGTGNKQNGKGSSAEKD
jgi:ATP synthase protein I